MLRRWASLAVLVFICNFNVTLDPPSFGQAESPNEEKKVVAIEIRGNHRIETSTILSRIKTKEGTPLSPELIREDISALYQLGFFLDVRVDSEPVEGGVKVIYQVSERPYVTETNFVGNAEILTDKLKEKVTIKSMSFLNDAQVKENAERIRQYYDEEGYYNTIVIPVIRQEGDKVALTFYIKEGAKATVKKIGFEGNKAYPQTTLQKNISTQEYSYLTSWLTSSGYYKKEALNEDVDRLKDFYLNNGYLQVQVGTPSVKFKEDRSQTLVTYPILHGELDYPYEFHTVRASIEYPLVEGEQFRIRTITLNGNHVYSTDRLREVLKLKDGDIFKKNVLREGVAAIHDLYGEKGYLYANVIPQYTSDPAQRTVDLTLEISEDNPMRIRQITITGDEKTRDKVIRREMRLDEQDLVDTRLLRRSFQRINNLNFFDSVEIVPQRVSPDQVDLNVKVKEKSTGAFSIGGGYSTVDRLVGMIDVTQGNLFGRGQLLRARAEFGKITSSYSLTFREPYILDYPVSGTVDLFNQRRDYDTYTEKTIGGDLILGRSFTEYVSGSMSYTLETLHITNLTSDAPDRIQEQAGKSVTGSIGGTLSRDTRDFYFDPTEGNHSLIHLQFANTYLGGNNNFIKTTLESGQYIPLFWSTVFSLHSRFGYATGMYGTPLPIPERYYVGGINTVRGFKYGKAGPVDPVTNEVLGGNKELIFNFEFIFPLVPEAKVKGVLFYDYGKGFDDNQTIRIGDLRSGTGVELRWISPIGPLRLEWGWNVHPQGNEPHSVVEFTIGTLF